MSDEAGAPKILSISFSPLLADARVLRQLQVLRSYGEVTTVGYGDAPEGVTRHIRVPDDAPSLPQTPAGVLKLALKLHQAAELSSPAEQAVREETVEAGPFDLVVANDARALPLAFAAADSAPVWADMHEWAPEEQSQILAWRLLVAPYMEHLCRRYLPHAAVATSVSSGLTRLYAERYGVTTELVRNAADLQNLTPSPVDDDRIRLVHSGIADRERNLPELIEAVGRLGDRFSLDLYLVEVPGGHLARLRKMAAAAERVTVHDPVPPEALPHVLNQYDLGVFLYPLKTLSQLHSLPNKFFDFAQARLGMVFSPAPEIDALLDQHGIGVTTNGTTADALVAALQDITAGDVRGYKDAADRAARHLSSEPDRATQQALVERLLHSTR